MLKRIIGTFQDILTMVSEDPILYSRIKSVGVHSNFRKSDLNSLKIFPTRDEDLRGKVILLNLGSHLVGCWSYYSLINR